MAGKVPGNTINKLSMREEEKGEKKTKSIHLNVPKLISRGCKTKRVKGTLNFLSDPTKISLHRDTHTQMHLTWPAETPGA